MAGKSDKPQQQQTLSIRISEALRERLERAKQLVATKAGKSVSTSDIAEQLLESVREAYGTHCRSDRLQRSRAATRTAGDGNHDQEC